MANGAAQFSDLHVYGAARNFFGLPLADVCAYPVIGKIRKNHVAKLLLDLR
jgi:hypothetical protein